MPLQTAADVRYVLGKLLVEAGVALDDEAPPAPPPRGLPKTALQYFDRGARRIGFEDGALVSRPPPGVQGRCDGVVVDGASPPRPYVIVRPEATPKPAREAFEGLMPDMATAGRVVHASVSIPRVTSTPTSLPKKPRPPSAGTRRRQPRGAGVGTAARHVAPASPDAGACSTTAEVAGDVSANADVLAAAFGSFAAAVGEKQKMRDGEPPGRASVASSNMSLPQSLCEGFASSPTGSARAATPSNAHEDGGGSARGSQGDAPTRTPASRRESSVGRSGSGAPRPRRSSRSKDLDKRRSCPVAGVVLRASRRSEASNVSDATPPPPLHTAPADAASEAPRAPTPARTRPTTPVAAHAGLHGDAAAAVLQQLAGGGGSPPATDVSELTEDGSDAEMTVSPMCTAFEMREYADVEIDAGAVPVAERDEGGEGEGEEGGAQPEGGDPVGKNVEDTSEQVPADESPMNARVRGFNYQMDVVNPQNMARAQAIRQALEEQRRIATPVVGTAAEALYAAEEVPPLAPARPSTMPPANPYAKAWVKTSWLQQKIRHRSYARRGCAEVMGGKNAARSWASAKPGPAAAAARAPKAQVVLPRKPAHEPLDWSGMMQKAGRGRGSATTPRGEGVCGVQVPGYAAMVAERAERRQRSPESPRLASPSDAARGGAVIRLPKPRRASPSLTPRGHVTAATPPVAPWQAGSMKGSFAEAVGAFAIPEAAGDVVSNGSFGRALLGVRRALDLDETGGGEGTDVRPLLPPVYAVPDEGRLSGTEAVDPLQTDQAVDPSQQTPTPTAVPMAGLPPRTPTPAAGGEPPAVAQQAIPDRTVGLPPRTPTPTAVVAYPTADISRELWEVYERMGTPDHPPTPLQFELREAYARAVATSATPPVPASRPETRQSGQTPVSRARPPRAVPSPVPERYGTPTQVVVSSAPVDGYARPDSAARPNSASSSAYRWRMQRGAARDPVANPLTIRYRERGPLCIVSVARVGEAAELEDVEAEGSPAASPTRHASPRRGDQEAPLPRQHFLNAHDVSDRAALRHAFCPARNDWVTLQTQCSVAPAPTAGVPAEFHRAVFPYAEPELTGSYTATILHARDPYRSGIEYRDCAQEDVLVPLLKPSHCLDVAAYATARGFAEEWAKEVTTRIPLTFTNPSVVEIPGVGACRVDTPDPYAVPLLDRMHENAYSTPRPMYGVLKDDDTYAIYHEGGQECEEDMSGIVEVLESFAHFTYVRSSCQVLCLVSKFIGTTPLEITLAMPDTDAGFATPAATSSHLLSHLHHRRLYQGRARASAFFDHHQCGRLCRGLRLPQVPYIAPKVARTPSSKPHTAPRQPML
eukprot:TRINITY_DN29783_c0_g1_i1.p1 TRINITY_DN29783_c0_g1~~TRINITY_DN29783_c0_g1_i1.p1  ORF type:complete len:1328 (+),score=202.68 TRINITY_DN29783_c0_g1_i1:126-4109(+)